MNIKDFSNENLLNNNLKKIIKSLSEASRELTKLLNDEFIGMTLFGSWARFEAKQDSDVDIFIVFKSIEGLEARSKIYRIIAKHVKKSLTLIDMRLNEILSDKLELTPLLINIIADSIIIQDKDCILKSFIEKGRKLIKKAKLVRYKTRNGKYGWKREDAKPLISVEI